VAYLAIDSPEVQIPAVSGHLERAGDETMDSLLGQLGTFQTVADAVDTIETDYVVVTVFDPAHPLYGGMYSAGRKAYFDLPIWPDDSAD